MLAHLQPRLMRLCTPMTATKSTLPVLFTNASVFDGQNVEVQDGVNVLVADGIIQEISTAPISSASAEVVDVRGHTLMPGLIDAHVHVYMFTSNPLSFVDVHPTYLAHHASKVLRFLLDRGVTSVRDVGGADVGLARALNEGLIQGPRLFYGGRILSQTGGHADIRSADRGDAPACACGNASPRSLFASVVDGVDAVRAAVREEFRKGAHHIKIMASGGVTSPTDPLESSQFSDAEIIACVDEATRLGRYVAAHCHPDAAIRRCAALGVRSIEHATLITGETAEVVAKSGAIAVPTISVIFAFKGEGERVDLPDTSREKLNKVSVRALESLDIMRKAGVKMGFGTDLPGTHLEYYGTEFTLRARVLSAADILISATGTNATLLGRSPTLGVIALGAAADILVVDGNPLEDIGLLAGGGSALRVIMKGGEFFRRAL